MSETTRTEYVVFIPSDELFVGRREVTRYPEQDAGEDPGDIRALEHVAHVHRLAAAKPGPGRRAECYAVKQVITVVETVLVSDRSTTP